MHHDTCLLICNYKNKEESKLCFYPYHTVPLQADSVVEWEFFMGSLCLLESQGMQTCTLTAVRQRRGERGGSFPD